LFGGSSAQLDVDVSWLDREGLELLGVVEDLKSQAGVEAKGERPR